MASRDSERNLTAAQQTLDSECIPPVNNSLWALTRHFWQFCTTSPSC